MGKTPVLFSDTEIDFYIECAKNGDSMPIACDKAFKKFSITRSRKSLQDALRLRFGKNWTDYQKEGLINSNPEKVDLKDELEKYFRKHRKVVSIKFLSEHFDRSEESIKQAVAILSDKGFAVELDDENIFATDKPAPTNKSLDICDWKKMTHKIGIVSDTEIGGVYYQHEYLKEMYRIFGENDCSFILHVGDMFHGSPNMHKGFEYEQALMGVEENLDWAIKNYPVAISSKTKKIIKTYIISGNHDLSFWKDNGTDIVKQFCLNRQDDTEYLGRIAAYVQGPNADPYFIYMFHPADGSAYARSFKDQKTSEMFEPKERPSISVTGHYHKYNQMELQGTEFIMCPSMVAQSDWMRSKRIVNNLGALMIEFNISQENFLNRIKIEKFRFTKYQKTDYGSRRTMEFVKHTKI